MYRSSRWGAPSLRASVALLGGFSQAPPIFFPRRARRTDERANAQRYASADDAGVPYSVAPLPALAPALPRWRQLCAGAPAPFSPPGFALLCRSRSSRLATIAAPAQSAVCVIFCRSDVASVPACRLGTLCRYMENRKSLYALYRFGRCRLDCFRRCAASLTYGRQAHIVHALKAHTETIFEK